MIRFLALLVLLVLVLIGGMVSGQIVRHSGDTRCVGASIAFNNGPVWYSIAGWDLKWPEFHQDCSGRFNVKTQSLE